jgi:F-type H+-transporting ATPase subunit b
LGQGSLKAVVFLALGTGITVSGVGADRSREFSPMWSLLLSITVDFDKSAFIQMVLFAGLILVLKPLLFDPMLALFAAREAGTMGARADARAMQEQAADILSRYETELGAAQSRAQAEREQSRRETAALEAEILKEGRDAADKVLSEGHTRMEGELRRLDGELKARGPELAKQISSSILGREPGL